MDSQLASALTSGSLEVQNGSPRGEESKPDPGIILHPKDQTSPRIKTGSLTSCHVKAPEAIRQDARSINGEKSEVGGTCEPVSQETSEPVVFRQPITVKAGLPVPHRQPIRIKILVPSRSKRPIPNSTIGLTKDCGQHFIRPVLVSAKRKQNHISADKEGERIIENTKSKEESFQETKVKIEDQMGKDGVKIVHLDRSEASFVSNSPDQVLSHQGIKEEHTQQDLPLIWQKIDLKSLRTCNEVTMEEQTEPLDLSLPKKRENRERKSGCFLDDSACESPLIMEVDEYEGDGDRDLVEEDSNEDSQQSLRVTEMFEESFLSPSYLSTSVLAEESDTENLLLIDAQGIPYMLSPDGLKVPQVDASASEAVQTDQVEKEGLPCLTKQTDITQSQRLDNALNAPSDYFHPASTNNSSSQDTDETKAPDFFKSLMTETFPSAATEMIDTSAQEANPVLSSSSGLPIPTQPIHILANPSASTPLLLLSSSSSSPVGLSLPLSVTQSSPGASAPMLLLLSSVTSSPGDPSSVPTTLAVLDPSTGQLSQIASAPVNFSLSSAQVGTLGSPLAHPVIRLSSNNPPVIVSSGNNLTSGPVLASLNVSPSILQEEHSGTVSPLQTPISYSISNPGNEAISAEEASNENKKPSALAASSPLSQSAAGQPSSEAEAQSPASDSKLDSSDLHPEYLHLDDHLYFANMAAPPSPPIGPILPSDRLDSLDPLDPLSAEESSNSLGSRRVLCCQLCPRIFFYLSDLERHAITHSQKKPHVCQQCGKAFKRSSHLQRHKHIHTGQRNFVCPICAKRFREAGELQRHQRVHTGEKPYQCQLCHTRFAERNTLRRHTKRKHPYHQVAMEMLNERRDKGGGRREEGGSDAGGVQEEESAEWYSSTVSTLENSESELET